MLALCLDEWDFHIVQGVLDEGVTSLVRGVLALLP